MGAGTRLLTSLSLRNPGESALAVQVVQQRDKAKKYSPTVLSLDCRETCSMMHPINFKLSLMLNM
jgi:hypothetical protein